MVDRYNCEYCNIIGENDMCEAKDGEWVKYDDIKHLLQNTSYNSECQHEYEYVNTTPFIGHKCKKCGHCI